MVLKRIKTTQDHYFYVKNHDRFFKFIKSYRIRGRYRLSIKMTELFYFFAKTHEKSAV